jgi:beta-lactamase superfamily II metal-dependent hydrolase
MLWLDNLSNSPYTPGSFSFYFISMGQGDCCIIGCPDRTVVVVDCGSLANCPVNAPTTIDTVITNITAGGARMILALILTHPDQDHYNQVYNVFSQYTIKNVYFSCASTVGYPLGNYSVGSVNQQFYSNKFKTAFYNEVTINSTTNLVKQWTQAQMAANAPPTSINLPNNEQIVAEGSINTNPWYVKIIAGNVLYPPNLTPDKDPNTASLVTAFGFTNANTNVTTTALVQGDATDTTSNFLMTTPAKAPYVTNVSLVQSSHHGSALWCNSEAYIDRLVPEAVVVSARMFEDNFHLPSWTVLKRFMDTPNIEHSEHFLHPLDGWYKTSDFALGQGSQTVRNIIAQWKATYPAAQIKTNLAQTKLWLDPVPQASGAYAVETMTGMILYREFLVQGIRETFPEAGLTNEYIHFMIDPS